ncbi:unnamed protein product [Symbiodinium sp. CCMP2456]|nr:unnamed protein product [Symbiodinium sp. CCMP2456]
MAKDYLALIDPTGNPVPIAREGTLVYLTPTVIPYAVADAARMAASCLPEVMTGIENQLGSVELRGVSDMHDGSIDHLFQIGALIAAAQGMKMNEGYRWDMWEVNESELKLIRHVRVWRHEMLDPRIKLANKSPAPITGQWSRLTGERVTYKTYKDGSTVTVRDENLLTMRNTRPKEPKEWRGRVEFGLKHKPQLRHVQKTAPRPYDPSIGRDKSKVVNAEVVESGKPTDVSSPRMDVEPEIIDRQVRVSRNVEEHELENALRSLIQRLQHPGLPTGGRLSGYLFGDRYTMFFDSNDPSMIDTETGHQNDWADIELPDGTVKRCDEPRASTGHKWIGHTLFVPLDRPKAGENEQETEDKNAVKPKGVKTPNEPSENERRLHELTHLPYRDWCEHCVRSKGRQNHAVKKNDRQPVIQIDFSFLSTDVQTGYAMAIVLPAKGSVEKYAVAELRCSRLVVHLGSSNMTRRIH